MEDYYGLPIRSIDNGNLRVVCLAETGPRIVGLLAKGISGNLLAETPEAYEDTPYGRYPLYGGHRLWEAPELSGVTGLPEGKVRVQAIEGGLHIEGEANALGLQKTIQIEFEAAPGSLRVQHHISNLGQQNFELAAWSITQLRPGCIVRAPLSQRSAGQTKMPNRNLVFWPYSKLPVDAIQFPLEEMLFDPARVEAPFKFGLFAGGLAQAVYNDYTFSKRFGAHPTAHYPDYACNLEIYVDSGYVELESLSPLAALAPGANISHEEIWEITLTGA